MEKYLVIDVEMVKVEGKFKKLVDVISDEPTSYYRAGKQLAGDRKRINLKTFNEELSRGWIIFREA
jgi:hypothetical protein